MYHFLFENSSLYSNYELAKYSLLPLRAWIQSSKRVFEENEGLNFGIPIADNSFKATIDLIERVTRNYEKPEFGITETKVDGAKVTILQTMILSKTFCKLLNFRKEPMIKQEKLLIVAPMSGHHATLLRGTVQDVLPHFDTYITDWVDARNVPISEGKFDLDDFIAYVQKFIEILGSDIHVMAVCQPTVPVLAAISLLASQGKKTPKSMILIGGPVDARKHPTAVNSFADGRSIHWFERNLISRVPCTYPGFMRQVYPGFIQLSGFMTMNMKRHMGEHMNLFKNLVIGDGESAEKHKKFYNEYLAVMDMPAEFYLQTIKTVFKDFDLPLGKMMSNGEKVKPEDIKNCAILCIEGELDDISGVGQTKAALNLCKNVPDDKKLYHLQKGVGHYGVFNGTKFRESIVPLIKKFTDKA